MFEVGRELNGSIDTRTLQQRWNTNIPVNHADLSETEQREHHLSQLLSGACAI